MKILCTQTNRNRLCDGCGDTASDNRCRACYDESRGIPDPVALTPFEESYLAYNKKYPLGKTLAEIKEKYPLPTGAVVLAEFSIGVDIGQDGDHSVVAIANKDLQKGDSIVVGQEIDRDYAAILAPIEEDILKSNQDIIDDMLATIKVSPIAAYSYQTFADIEPPSPLNFPCVPLPYIEPLYSKELPTKPGVYSVRYKGYDCYETMEVQLKEKTKDGKTFFVEDPRIIKGGLDLYTLHDYQLMGAEWLFVRDLETQEID